MTIGSAGVIFLPVLLLPVAGLLATTAMSVFAAGALANAILLRTFRTRQLVGYGPGLVAGLGQRVI